MHAPMHRLRIALACASSAGLAQFMPSPPAAAADTQAESQLARPEAMGADGAVLAHLARAVAAGKYPKTTSVLVVYRDRLIYEGYFGQGGRAYLNNTRSATKSITALAVGAAIDDHSISAVSAPALRYLADVAPF